MSITGIVENDTIKLPIHVPNGTEVEIIVKDEAKTVGAQGSFLDTIQDLVGSADGLPEDFAAEHDHYIHGTPKRSAK